MNHIKKITAKEMNEALRNYFNVASAKDFWEVKGMYAKEGDLCYSTLDNNCFYYMDLITNDFVYFALEQGRFENIRGLFESFYKIVCEGYPFIRINGIKGRYPKVLKNFDYYKKTDSIVTENEEYIWFIGHPENIEKFKRRF